MTKNEILIKMKETGSIGMLLQHEDIGKLFKPLKRVLKKF